MQRAMADFDLFQAEEAALTRALGVHARSEAGAEAYRLALGELIARYQRLMREMRRVIRHGDRQERELNALNARLRQLAGELDYKATHDSLTGELNRAAVIDLVTQHLARTSTALIVLDIDHFKRINDNFGHPAGDAVIVELVQRLKSALPLVGQLGRVGGEEFTVVLPGMELASAIGIAEGMRRAVCARPFAKVTDREVTASFGVSWNAAGTTFDQAYARADEALYAAKRGGRNRVVSAEH
ncbi:MAG TPA: GGDEF domain-containing protein [Rhodanobacteraceae bacterium]|nr:GGDEF domain-containing protein [Rhodanobacteraceae bacterium]